MLKPTRFELLIKIQELKKLVDLDIKSYDEDIDFPYEESLDKVNCSKIVFENKKYKFEYIIASNGEYYKF